MDKLTIPTTEMISLSDAILRDGDADCYADATLPSEFILQEVRNVPEDLLQFKDSDGNSSDSWSLQSDNGDMTVDYGTVSMMTSAKGQDIDVDGGSLKDHLRKKIQLRRQSEGRGMPEVLFEEPKVYELSTEEQQRQRRRRERNRLSANKSRIKRIHRQQSLEKEAEQLEVDNHEVKNRITSLEKLKSMYLKMLRTHACKHETVLKNDGTNKVSNLENLHVRQSISDKKPDVSTVEANKDVTRKLPILRDRQISDKVGNDTRKCLTENSRMVFETVNFHIVPSSSNETHRSRPGENMTTLEPTNRLQSLDVYSPIFDSEENGIVDQNRCIAKIKLDLEESTKNLWSCL